MSDIVDTRAPESMTQFVWAQGPSLAWGLVSLLHDHGHDFVRPYVYDTREAAEAADADTSMGPTLYRVERTCVLADESTPAPKGGSWAFTYSTNERGCVWNAVDIGVPQGEQFNGLAWRFPDAAEPTQRAEWANQEPRTLDAGVTFRAYLLTWSVGVIERHDVDNG
ncbi:hypothetical protein OG497_37865 [Streptomyces sp. NBC_01242]|uniref:hypothetical protein n=1 Tax=Streptomyces sp. NBC_01242 TaxID=2903795 RepID=UPI00224FCA61|nr:hypothetical protein [Streptomyces sp. NBC_01242]MCX4799626.1 hypothetical protein [Streptomyces sp. NBC_01242]